MFATLLLLAAAAQAEAPPRSEPCACGSESVRLAIAAVEEAWDFDTDPTYEHRTEAMRKVVEAWPSDVEAHVGWQSSGFTGQRRIEELRAEYLALRDAAHGAPVAEYLFGRVARREEAARIAADLVANRPEAPWGHLLAAQAESWRPAPDPAVVRAGLEKFLALCPDSPLGVDLATVVGDPGFADLVASTMRPLLEREPALEARWRSVWTLEFVASPIEEHPRIRERIRRDVERLWPLLAKGPQLAPVVLEGAGLVDDPDLRRSAEEEVLRARPRSWDAFGIVRERFWQAHPPPATSAAEEVRTAWLRRLLDATGEWTARWPEYPIAWASRVDAIARLPEVSDEEAMRAGDGLLRALEARPRDVTSHAHPHRIRVAELWLGRGLRLAEVRHLAEVAPAFEEESLRSGARGTAEDFRRVIEDVEWLGKAIRVEADARLGRLAEARAGLAAMSAAAKGVPDGDSSETVRLRQASRGALVHRARAGLALAEGRRSEALAELRRAVSVFPPDLRRNPVEEEARRRARRLLPPAARGEAAFEQWLSKGAAPVEVAAPGWEKRARELPDGDLRTLDGEPFRFADLRGKSLFVCLWATWCGPCRAELPYVKALEEGLRTRRDVAVVTLNVDENPGVVAPFVRDSGYGFPVLFGSGFVRALYGGDVSIPRSWIVSPDGVIVLEREGFAGGETVRDFVERVRKLLERTGRRR